MNVDADEAHLRRLAQIVNDRVAALGPAAQQKASPAQLLAMVALGLADDLLAESARANRVEQSTRRAIASAIERIDRRLAQDMAHSSGGV